MITEEFRKSILDFSLKGKLSISNSSEKVNVANIKDYDNVPYEIPTNWKWLKIKDFCTLIRGNGIKKNETTESGIQCIRYGEIYTNYSYTFNKSISYVPENIAEKCREVKTNDLLLTLTGENEYDIAKATAYLGREKLVSGGDLAILTNHNQNTLFLSYFFASPFCISQKASTAKGNIIVHTSTDKIGEYMIPLPPLEEQQRIVDKINELFEKLNEIKPIEEELMHLKEDFSQKIKKSLLVYAMQGNLTKQHSEERAIDIKNVINYESIPKNWIRVKAKEILNISTGRKDANYGTDDGEYLFYTCANIPIKSPTYSFEGKNIILPGNGANVGLAIYSENKFEAYQRTYVVNSKFDENEILLKYIYYYFVAYWNDYNKNKMFGSAIPYIKLGNLENFEINLPPKEEQQRIVNKIEQLLQLCDDIEK